MVDATIASTAADDRDLVERLKRRDEKAFRAFVAAYQRPVYALVYRMLGDEEEARDLSQEVFVSVFRAIGSFRGESRLSTWLFRIVTNHCRNRQKYLGRRQHGKRQPYEETEENAAMTGGDATVLGERPPRPDREVEGRRLETALQRAIAALDPEQRELVVLRDIQGLTYEDIQRVTGLPEGTVKSRLHRARLALKEAIAPHVDGSVVR